MPHPSPRDARRCITLIATACVLTASFALAQPTPSAPPAPTKGVTAAVRDLATMRGVLEARDALRNYPAPQVIDALITAINTDPDFAEGKSTRLRAYEALATAGEVTRKGVRLDNDAQIAQLVRGLSESTKSIRAACADALGRVSDDRRAAAKEALVKALSDPWDYVELQALHSLARLAIAEPVPPDVWKIATAPTLEMKDRWRKAPHPHGWDVPKFDNETRIRGAAMRVVIAWEGFPRPYAADVKLDSFGTTARTMAAVHVLMEKPEAMKVDEATRSAFLRDAVAFFKEGDGDPTDLDKGVLMALAAVAGPAAPEESRAAANAALYQCAQATSPPKRAAAKAVLDRLESAPRDERR